MSAAARARTTNSAVEAADDAKTRALFRQLSGLFRPPENLNVSEWAEKYRRLSSATSAEAGPWRTSRTPYLYDPMVSFSDPKVNHIVVVAGSQIGKSEFELNCLGYIIAEDPGSVLYVHPTVDDAKKFSRIRIAPMIRDSAVLRQRVSRDKGRDASNTALQKTFPGGVLTITGSNAPSALASTPCRYIIGDEMDRWAKSAGKEGDPWELARARQTTFYNRKAIEVSTPTVVGDSRIAAAFETGTMERWCHLCPDCESWTNIQWKHIRMDYDTTDKNGVKSYLVKSVLYVCPECGAAHTELEMRAQPQKWIAENPGAIEKGCRSFWLNAFCSPWVSWKTIAQEFLDAKDDPSKLEVIYNTKFGMLWEKRGDTPDDDTMLKRRELYGAELPEGVLLLTCGVDTQDDRLEYEIVGHGRWGETWGIEYGIIPGRPDMADSDGVWKRLDEILDKAYRFADGRWLKIAQTFIDSGGHFTKDVYWQCAQRFQKRVFPIKGKGGDGVPYTDLPKKRKIIVDKRKLGEVWLYTIGVDAGKTRIMNDLRVQQVGNRYCHFPSDEGKEYGAKYFNGLLSEHLTLTKGRTGGKWVWEKLPGRKRNEPLDIRNYALAAESALSPDYDRLEKELSERPVLADEPPAASKKQPQQAARPRRRVIKNSTV